MGSGDRYTSLHGRLKIRIDTGAYTGKDRRTEAAGCIVSRHGDWDSRHVTFDLGPQKAVRRAAGGDQLFGAGTRFMGGLDIMPQSVGAAFQNSAGKMRLGRSKADAIKYALCLRIPDGRAFSL